MVAIQEILGTLSSNRRKNIYGSPACNETEDNFRNYMVDMIQSGKTLTPIWKLVTTGDNYKVPTADALVICKPYMYHETSSLILYSSDPALEGMVAKEYGKEPTPFYWLRPKRPLYTYTDFPLGEKEKLQYLNFPGTGEVIPTIDLMLSLISQLGCQIGTHFVENVTTFSEWLCDTQPHIVRDIWNCPSRYQRAPIEEYSY